MRHIFLNDKIRKSIATPLRCRQDKRSAGHQCCCDLRNRGIKAWRCKLKNTIARRNCEAINLGCRKIWNATMLDDDALWCSG